MKKILAVVIALVMTFSVAVIPVTASIDNSVQDAEDLYGNASSDISGVVDDAEDIYNAFEEGDYTAAVKSVFVFLENLFDAIHGIVHGLSEMFDFNCPFCDGDYDFGSDEDKVTTEPTTEEPTTEEPTTEEPTTEEPTTEEPTTEEPTTEEPTTEEPTTEEPTTEEPTTEEPTTEEPTTEEPTTEEPTTEEPTTEEPTTEEPTTEEPTTEEPTTEAPVVKYETYHTKVTNTVLAGDRYFNYTSNGLYPQNTDVCLYFWNRNYKAGTVTIKNMATAYVNAAVYISEESAGIDTITFAGGNNFHSNNGVFKLIVNTTDKPVKVKLSGTNKIGSVVLTKDNIGNYIVGPYTIV